MSLEREAEDFLNIKLNKSRSMYAPSYIYTHAECVKTLCMSLARFSFASRTILKAAAWLHDIGRVDGDNNHKKNGIGFAEAWLASQGIENSKFIKKLKDCILNHSADDTPETKEGKILRVANGLSHLHPKMLEYNFEKNGIAEIRECIRKAAAFQRISFFGKLLRAKLIRKAKKKYQVTDELEKN